MQRQFTHCALRHHTLDTRVGNLLQHLLQLHFLATRKVAQLLRIVQKDGALGLRLANVETTGEHSHLGTTHRLDAAFRLASEHHTTHDAALCQATAHDLDDSHIVHAKVAQRVGRGRKYQTDSLCHKRCQQVFVAILLRRQRRTQCQGERLLRGRRRERSNRQFLQQLKSTVPRQFVSLHNLRRVQAQGDEQLGLAQELAGENQHKVGRIAHLGLLLL